MLGINCRTDLNSIGDSLSLASFPENFFHTYGEKVIDIQKYWFFDFNPYVVRDVEPTSTLDLYLQNEYKTNIGRNLASIAERTAILNKLQIVLRHPRLYKYENEEINPRGLTLHISGKTSGSIPDWILETIYRRYKNWDIVQIGSITDKATPFKQKLGLPIWETVNIIAQNAYFIGSDSGPLNIAMCYPHINKKCVLSFLEKDLCNWSGLQEGEYHTHWFDHSIKYFNCYPYDIGITTSYLKI